MCTNEARFFIERVMFHLYTFTFDMKLQTTIPLMFFFCFFLVIEKAAAVPAYPHKILVTLENGKIAEIYLRGDEHLKYAISADGYTLLNDENEWWYATLSQEGNVIRSKYKLVAIEDESTEVKIFKEGCPQGIMPKYLPLTSVNQAADQRTTKAHDPIIGERRALVVLMEFKDHVFSKTREDFSALFNGVNYHENDAIGSVRDYYRFASQGQLDYISDIYGPYTSIYPMSYYGSNSTIGGSDAHAVDLCIEAMRNLPDSIDFSIYDNDGDGLIDNVHIIYAGFGEEAGGSSEAIWAHEYPHRIALKNEIGYSLAGYSCSPELRGYKGDKISHIGVVCHELGHSLGAMDYYDTNYDTGGKFDGTGQWDIMAQGSWNDDGRTPPNFNPYVRSSVFGWNTQTLLTPDLQIVMPKMEEDNAEQSVVYRIETNSEGDYFLLENRQKDGFDAALPGAGLMIYHVHPYIDIYSTTNTINATHPQGLYPVCASFSEPGKKQYGNINSAECPFPGIKNSRSFTPTSSPAAVAWNGHSAKVSISSIYMNQSNGSITFHTKEESNTDPDDPDVPVARNLIYKESFESNISDRFAIYSITGKENWRTYKKGNYVLNADAIPQPTDGEKILMLFSGKENTISESEASSTDIDVDAGINYTISLDIYIEKLSAAFVPLFDLFIEDDFGEYKVYTLNEVTNQWKTIEIPMVFAGNYFRCKLYGRIGMGGIFIDNIQLYKEEESPMSISQRVIPEPNKMGIRTLMGTPVTQETMHSRPGIYIQNGRKIIIIR